MFIKFKADYAGHKSGEVVEFDDPIARAFVEQGKADEHKEADTALSAAFASELRTALDQRDTAMRTAITEALRGAPGTGTGGTGRPTVRIEAVEDKSKGFADIVRCIYGRAIGNNNPEYAAFCNRRLNTVYKDEVKATTWKAEDFDDADPEQWHRAARNMGEQAGGNLGGFLIQPEYLQSVYSIEAEQSIVEPKAFHLPMGSKELFWPALDQYQSPSTGATSYAAGVKLYRKSEKAARTETDPNLSQIHFTATDLTGLAEVSRDLLSDSVASLNALLNQTFGIAFAHKKDYEFLRGDNVGKPLGVFNAPALLTKNRNTASHIYYEDLVGLLSKLAPPSWNRACWISNITCATELTNIKTSGGTFAYIPNAQQTQQQAPGTRPNGELLGLPLYYTEKVPTLGNQGDFNLFDLSAYGVATRAGLEIGISEHFLFDTDQVAFRFKLRNDGRPLWRKPFTQSDGGTTQISPFVQLV